ncbi:isoprenylcysteine carboxylmethyltransferase family protein [Aquiluna borgnonia]|uniref:Isoprenylcysteine carboxylmethyltransferase family protein n=1 Tax=Aquiluna borgnonia TaxID=2499157 RepID=A0A7D4QCC1_9MICO|nr:isoprenylcysteine carboxylmethyltransferase family protein [Aquiluna borgnonia]QKJ25870.1 isoprenylcysteine carboxylmethyltransferase family protein [Aquiluna borgnonia]
MNDKSRAYSYVAVQFLLIALLFTSPRMSEPYFELTGVFSTLGLIFMGVGALVLLLSFTGLGKSLTASPIPKADGELVTTGLYSRVRHPIYFGLLMLGFGVVLDAGYWPQVVILAFLYLLLRIKAQFEEELLKKRYPDYEAYMARTPRFFPRLTK